MRRHQPLVGSTLFALFAAGCSCGEPVIPVPPNPDPETTGDTSVELTGHTGAEPPCDAPEFEPNDTPQQPNTLPLNRDGCGAFQVEGDFDYWTLDVTEPSWLEVRVNASAGGLSDVAVIVSGSSEGVGVARDDGTRDSDVLLLFPAPVDRYSISVREQQAKAGERYTYDLSASVAKDPLFYDRDGALIAWTEELEPNDDISLAAPLRDGDAVLGLTEESVDIDWFRVGVPAGKHSLRFEIQAFEMGSGGNYTLTLFDESLEQVEIAANGDVGFEPDPVLEFNSSGDEVLYLQVREADNKGNAAIWYLLETTVEAD
jgi:hypothetical protein